MHDQPYEEQAADAISEARAAVDRVAWAADHERPPKAEDVALVTGWGLIGVACALMAIYEGGVGPTTT